jgi:hypothetical protein
LGCPPIITLLILYVCLEHDILKEFFEKNAAEVIDMLMTEWNMEDALAIRDEISKKIIGILPNELTKIIREFTKKCEIE